MKKWGSPGCAPAARGPWGRVVWSVVCVQHAKTRKNKKKACAAAMAAARCTGGGGIMQRVGVGISSSCTAYYVVRYYYCNVHASLKHTVGVLTVRDT